MKKKYGFIIMGDYDIEKDRARFESEDMITEVFTVRNMVDAEKRVEKMKEEGFGAIECCGAFSEENIDSLKTILDGSAGIARVVATEDQGRLLGEFFGD